MEKSIQFHLEDFEGPLDLLLALVQKNKMSIYDIEILTLIDQYLQVVGEPGPQAMESASEFITMAARLVQLKSAMLLPRSEEAERMREELTGLLVEYSACKEVAGRLREMAAGVYIVARRPAVVQLETTYQGTHDLKDLTGAFSCIMGRSTARRMPRVEQFDEIVTAPQVSVDSRAFYLLKGLRTGGIHLLRDAFAPCIGRGRGVAVATFLALLELIRNGRVKIDDKETLWLADESKRKNGVRVGAERVGVHGTE